MQYIPVNSKDSVFIHCHYLILQLSCLPHCIPNCDATCRRSCLKLVDDDHLHLCCNFHSMCKTHRPLQSTQRLCLNSISVQIGHYDLCTLVYTVKRNACNATPASNYSAAPPLRQLIQRCPSVCQTMDWNDTSLNPLPGGTRLHRTARRNSFYIQSIPKDLPTSSQNSKITAICITPSDFY